MSTHDDIRELLACYPSEPEPDGATEMAAEILGQYFTADDIRKGIAEGGSIGILAFADADEDSGPAAPSPAAGPRGSS